MYKTSEDLQRVIAAGKPDNVIDLFAASYLQGQAYAVWIDERRAEHAALFPESVDGDPVYDVDGTTVLYYEQIANPDFISFDSWMEETEAIELVPAYVDDDGIEHPAIIEEHIIRAYVEAPIDIDKWKLENYAIFREAAYPSWKVFADAWVKNDTAAMEEYRAMCLEVKTKYPKPI